MAVLLDEHLRFVGSTNDLPKDATIGSITFNTEDSELYVYDGNTWALWANVVGNRCIIDDLMEVLNKYPDSSIGKEVRILLEAHRRKSYV